MFALSKIAGALLEPVTLLLWLLAAAATLMVFGSRRWTRRGRGLAVSVTAALVLIALLPVGQWLAAPLENRFPPPLPLPARVDGVVVLGGAVEPGLSAARHQVILNGAAERMVALVELGRRYPGARLVFSGGSGSVRQADLKEAPFVRVLLDQLGFDSHRVIFEADSRTTWENAVFSRKLAAPAPDQTWLLVTSAMHMPRAVGAFAAAGWRVVPYPVDFRTPDGDAPLSFSPAALKLVAAATHEWEGLLYYRLRGWSGSLFPGPDAL